MSRERAVAAAEIAEAAKALKERAETHNLRLAAYLLDLVALEARDCHRSWTTQEKAAGTKKA